MPNQNIPWLPFNQVGSKIRGGNTETPALARDIDALHPVLHIYHIKLIRIDTCCTFIIMLPKLKLS